MKVFAERNGRRHEWSYAQIEGKVQLSDAVLKSTGIDIQAVGPRRITSVLEVPGQIVADDTRVAHVVPRLSGVVVSVARKVGDAVRRGDVLAVVHSRELADARSAYLVATHHTEFARGAAAREEALWKKKISAEQEYLAAKRDFEEAALAETVARQTARRAWRLSRRRSRPWLPHPPRRCRATRFARPSTASCSSAT